MVTHSSIFNFKMEKEKIFFIKRTAIFIIIFIIIFLLLNQFYINKIENKKLIHRREIEWQNYLNTLPDKTLNYAFFGDSHAGDAINPEYIPNSFNFANGGEDYTETYFKIIKLLEKDEVKIKNFVLEIDVVTFSTKYKPNGTETFKNLNYFSKFMSYKDLAHMKGENKLAIYIKSKFPVLGGGNDFLKYFLKYQKLTPMQKGWLNLTGNFTPTNKNQSKMGEYNNYPDSINHKSINYFLKIIDIAQEKNISIIIIKYPKTAEYDQKIKRLNISRKNYYKKVFKIIDEKTTDYKILDYYSDFFHSPELFNDESHLNHIGSTIISQKFSEEAEEITNLEKTPNIKENKEKISKTIYLNGPKAIIQEGAIKLN